MGGWYTFWIRPVKLMVDSYPFFLSGTSQTSDLFSCSLLQIQSSQIPKSVCHCWGSLLFWKCSRPIDLPSKTKVHVPCQSCAERRVAVLDGAFGAIALHAGSMYVRAQGIRRWHWGNGRYSNRQASRGRLLAKMLLKYLRRPQIAV